MKIALLGVQHPIYTFLFTYASFKAFTKAKELYPESSSNNGKGNAFRHAYWCCLIMMYFCKISSPRKSLKWCEIYTDFHEEMFPNHPMETKMDLHNNRVGMRYFMELLPGVHRQFFETSFFIEGLMEKTENALIIKNLDEVINEDRLICLE